MRVRNRDTAASVPRYIIAHLVRRRDVFPIVYVAPEEVFLFASMRGVAGWRICNVNSTYTHGERSVELIKRLLLPASRHSAVSIDRRKRYDYCYTSAVTALLLLLLLLQPPVVRMRTTSLLSICGKYRPGITPDRAPQVRR